MYSEKGEYSMLTLGKKIQKARKEANISQVELAKKLNVRQGSISNWERDERKPDQTRKDRK